VPEAACILNGGTVKLTPLDISKQEFKKTMRGFDPVEVHSYLEMIGSELEKILGTNKVQERKLIELETELKNYKEVEKTLKATLMNVQETSSKSRENSKKEADLILREAELSAAKILENAKREKQTLQEEIITLRTQKQSLIARLRHVLNSQLELMEVLEVDDLDMSKLRDRSKKVFAPRPDHSSVSESAKAAAKVEQTGLSAGQDEKKNESTAQKQSDLLKDLLDEDLNLTDEKS
jgi:cell division initiation protein